MKNGYSVSLTALLLASSLPTISIAQTHDHGAHQHEHASQGIGPQVVGQYKIDSKLQFNGIMFMISDLSDKRLSTSELTGKLMLRVGKKAKVFEYELLPLKNQALGVAVDLSTVAGQDLHMDIEIIGLSSGPLNCHIVGKLSAALDDSMLVQLQKTCPVTGKPLGSMGKPPKIMFGDKPLFVCCAGCETRLKATPEKYISKYYGTKGKQVRPGVWEATLADADAIAAQSKCPVMDEALGGMGIPQKVNVKGKAVYICCAGCAKKLDAEPERYLAVLANLGVTPPDFK